MDDTMMTEPPPRSAIEGMAIWQSQWLLRMLLAITLSKALSGISWLGPKWGLTAALQTRTSIGPKASSVLATRRARSSLLPMLHGTTVACPPLARIASL